jgi:hypothetical protein
LRVYGERGDFTGLARTLRPFPCCKMVIFTGTTPACTMPIFFAAATDKSMTRPWTNGPRSLIRTSTLSEFSLFVTRIMVLNGSVRWAAVMSLYVSNISPFAVLRP